MKQLFRKNYLWAIVAAVFVAVLITPAIPTQAQLIDNLGPLPQASSEGTKPDKAQMEKARNAICGSNEDCKTGFDEVIKNGYANMAQVCGQTGTAGVNRAVNEFEKPYCAAGAYTAGGVVTDFNTLTSSGGTCTAPMAAEAIKNCMTGYYRGLRGLSNNCSGATKAKCTEAFNQGKATNATAKQQMNSAKNIATSQSGGSGSNNEDDASQSCENSDSDLGWIACPMISALNKVLTEMDSAINNLLEVDTNKLFGSSNADEQKVSDAYYKAWAIFRTFALGFVVIMALIVIISTAFGYEILDAYTIRKVLPRLLIAIIGITLSWSILEFLVTLTNDLGNGIRALIYAPFNGISVGDGGENLNFSGGIEPVLAAIGIGTVVAFTGMGVLAMLGAAFLAVLCAFLVLVAREMIIIILVITAPIGIAMLILPNTRKFWQFWQTTLAAMLIAFPFIAAMIATGRVFAMVTLSFDQGDLIYNLIALVAYILPYFMLPFAFKFAGGVLGTLSGSLGAQTGGLSKGLNKYASGKRQQAAVQGQNFNRWNERTAMGRGLNTVYGAAANPRSMLQGRKGVAAARMSRQKTFGAAQMKDNAVWNANQGDDAFLLAVADRKLAETKRDQAIAEGKTANAANYQHALDLASAMGPAARSRAVRSQALLGLAKTGYQFAPGEQGYEELTTAARSISGSDQGVYSSLMNEAQFNLKSAGRSDLGGINNGDSLSIGSGVEKVDSFTRGRGKTDTYSGAAQSYLGRATVNANSGKTHETAEEIRQGIVASLGRPTTQGGTDLNKVAEWHAILTDDYQSASPVNKKEIKKQLDAIESLAVEYGAKAPQASPSDPGAKFVSDIRTNQRRSRMSADPRDINPDVK